MDIKLKIELGIMISIAVMGILGCEIAHLYYIKYRKEHIGLCRFLEILSYLSMAFFVFLLIGLL